MCAIIKIVIKGSSGFGPGDEAYEDKLSLTCSSIAYEYKPLFATKNNPVRKWSYRTTSEDFSMAFSQVAQLMPAVLEPEYIAHCCDAGMIDFTVTYADKSKKKKTYWCSGDDFRDLFELIRSLIPQAERTPEVIIISADFEEIYE